jgi:hypothetical protein
MTPDWDGLALGGVRRAARTTIGGAVLVAVLATNPSGSRDWLIETAADHAQRKADRVVRSFLEHYESNAPGTVTPPSQDPMTPNAAWRQP